MFHVTYYCYPKALYHLNIFYKTVKLRSATKLGYKTSGCRPINHSTNDEAKKRDYITLTRDVQDMYDTVGSTYANTSNTNERRTPVILRQRPAHTPRPIYTFNNAYTGNR